MLATLVNTARSASVLSQPFPLLFHEAKKAFYRLIRHPEKKYVLNNFFLESRYTIEDFTAFLNHWRVTKSIFKSVKSQMHGWSGQYSPVSFADRDIPTEGYLLDQIAKVILLSEVARSTTKLVGSKEVMCEEFIPFLTQRGWKVVLILRDPRDVLTSIQFGRGNQFTGLKRPTLFHARNWRKSAQIALLVSGNPNVMVVRYEDILTDPLGACSRLGQLFSLDVSSIDCERVISRNSSDLLNSSFPEKVGVVRPKGMSPIGRHREMLSRDMRCFVEFICGPEMLALGYTIGDTDSYNPTKFKEPFKIESRDFSQDYSSQDAIDDEMVRSQMIKQKAKISSRMARSYFLNKSVYKKLLKCQK